MLNGHIELHYPFYFRLKELLTNQVCNTEYSLSYNNNDCVYIVVRVE